MAKRQTNRDHQEGREVHSPKLQRIIDWCTVLFGIFIVFYFIGIVNVTIDLVLGSKVDKFTFYSFVIGFFGTFVTFVVVIFSPVGRYILKQLK